MEVEIPLVEILQALLVVMVAVELVLVLKDLELQALQTLEVVVEAVHRIILMDLLEALE